MSKQVPSTGLEPGLIYPAAVFVFAGRRLRSMSGIDKKQTYKNAITLSVLFIWVVFGFEVSV